MRPLLTWEYALPEVFLIPLDPLLPSLAFLLIGLTSDWSSSDHLDHRHLKSHNNNNNNNNNHQSTNPVDNDPNPNPKYNVFGHPNSSKSSIVVSLFR